MHEFNSTTSTPREERCSLGEPLRECLCAGRTLPPLAICLFAALHDDDWHLDKLHGRLAFLEGLGKVEDLQQMWGIDMVDLMYVCGNSDAYICD